MLCQLRTLHDRPATAVMLLQAAQAVATLQLGQVASRDEGRDQRGGVVVVVDPRTAMRIGITVPRRCGARAQQCRCEQSDQD